MRVFSIIVCLTGIYGHAALTVPDIDSLNWILYDDMQSGSENLYNKWDIECSTTLISVGTGYTSQSGHYTRVSLGIGEDYQATLTPHITQEVQGVSASFKLTILTAEEDTFSMSALGVEIMPGAYFYFGLFNIDGQLKGTFATEENGHITTYSDAPYFDFKVGLVGVPYYDLSLVFEDETKTFWMYLNDEFFGYATIPLDEVSFGTPFIEVYADNARTNLCLQDFEVAVIPEPATLLLLGLGSLFIRKHY